MKIIELSKVVAGYGPGNVVLHEITFSLHAGSVTALSGVNGAGKTTLASTLAGRIKPISGNIYYKGDSIERLSTQERVRRGIVLCPQGREIFPQLTVEENLKLGALMLPKMERAAGIEQVLRELPTLREMIYQNAGALSGGQQQLLALARSAISRPKVLIVDEPSMGLAPAIVELVYTYLKKLKSTGVALLVIEESPLRLIGIADTVILLRGGQITQQGGPELLRDETVLTSALLGSASYENY